MPNNALNAVDENFGKKNYFFPRFLLCGFAHMQQISDLKAIPRIKIYKKKSSLNPNFSGLGDLNVSVMTKSYLKR